MRRWLDKDLGREQKHGDLFNQSPQQLDKKSDSSSQQLNLCLLFPRFHGENMGRQIEQVR